MLNAPSHAHLAYRPGVPLVHAVYQSGAARLNRQTDSFRGLTD
jgi:hypothetical protein